MITLGKRKKDIFHEAPGGQCFVIAILYEGFIHRLVHLSEAALPTEVWFKSRNTRLSLNSKMCFTSRSLKLACPDLLLKSEEAGKTVTMAAHL